MWSGTPGEVEDPPLQPEEILMPFYSLNRLKRDKKKTPFVVRRGLATASNNKGRSFSE